VQLRAAILLGAVLVFSASLLVISNSSAQATSKIMLQSTAKTTKYGQVNNLVVGDVPNHVLRIFEIHRTYPDNPPVINGSKLVDWWVRGIADLVGGNGRATEYEVFVMDNGDKFFGRAASVVQNSSGKMAAFTSGEITGGTGKLAGIRGVMEGSSNIDIKAGFNEDKTEIDYSLAE
jgi:hypothetical protein